MPLRGIVCLFAILGVVGSLGYSPPVQGAANLKGDPAHGAELAESCAACHGSDGMGYPEGLPRIVGQSASYLRSQLLLFRHSAQLRAGEAAQGGIAHLKSKARSFSGMDDFVLGLTDQDIADVSAYYASLKCKPSNKPRPARPRTAYRCEACHKDDGTKSSRGVPTLASQNAVYLSRQLKLYRSAKSIDDIDLMAEGTIRYSRIMFTQSRWLTDSLVKNLARFYESVPCE